MKKLASIAIAGLAAIVLNSSCFHKVSEETYIGEVVKKDYYVWKCGASDTTKPEFKLYLKTEKGELPIDFTCPELTMDTTRCVDVKDDTNPDYNNNETKANSDIKQGDKMEITISQWKCKVLYLCPVIEYKKQN